MGCPSEVEIGDNLVFTVNVHDPSSATNEAIDADSPPTYLIYEDETGTAILSGSMAKLDDANTLGFYSESVSCSEANGFENGKSYSVYVTALVGGSQGTTSYGFKAYDARKATVEALSPTIGGSSSPIMIVTRQQAADHLRIDDATPEADDLDLKILAASAIVLDYIEASASDYETDSEDEDYYYASGPTADDDTETVYVWPYQLQAATLLLVGDMHRYRDSTAPEYSGATLPPAVRSILYPLKTWGTSEDDA